MSCGIESRKVKWTQGPDLKSITISHQKLRKINAKKDHLKGMFDLNLIFP